MTSEEARMNDELQVDIKAALLKLFSSETQLSYTEQCLAMIEQEIAGAIRQWKLRNELPLINTGIVARDARSLPGANSDLIAAAAAAPDDYEMWCDDLRWQIMNPTTEDRALRNAHFVLVPVNPTFRPSGLGPKYPVPFLVPAA